jgi:hypothetical protein
MRRTLALLALLATSWPHVAALECALGATELPAPAEAARDRGSARGGHGHDPHGHSTHGHGAHGREARGGPPDGTALHAGPEADGAPTGGPQCALVMACGLVMIQADPSTADLGQPSPCAAGRGAAIDAPQAAVLVADPPPPRRIA